MTETQFRALAQMVDAARFAMLTSQNAAGLMRSRPLTTVGKGFDGTLWFMVGADADVVEDVQAVPQVNVAYSNLEQQEYVSMSGIAEIVQDDALAEGLWTPGARAFFAGPTDPRLRLLRIEVCDADYWDAPNSRLGRVAGFLKALSTRDARALGTRERVKLRRQPEQTLQ